MVSSLEEIRQYKAVFAEARDILKKEGKNFNPEIELGMMVEIPSAAILAEAFAGEVDFFSIGTNDLVQYTLAVDRANEKISRLYNHYHPALLELIQKVIDVGKKTNTPVSMCGEMAGDPVAVPLLIGMGLTIFSAAQIMIPEIKNVIRNLSSADCQNLYNKTKKLKTATEIQKLCEDFYNQLKISIHNFSS
jgi:phosphotransferase system enzyme I (PtsI)